MKPFLKWAGGKYKIIDKVVNNLPAGNRLIEPFVGSGAVFMNTHYESYILGDANAISSLSPILCKRPFAGNCVIARSNENDRKEKTFSR
jgi:hypothetical protein